jgi:hypothetical protein
MEWLYKLPAPTVKAALCARNGVSSRAIRTLVRAGRGASAAVFHDVEQLFQDPEHDPSTPGATWEGCVPAHGEACETAGLLTGGADDGEG